MCFSSSRSPGGATLFCTFDEMKVDRCIRNKLRLKCTKVAHIMQINRYVLNDVGNQNKVDQILFEPPSRYRWFYASAAYAAPTALDPVEFGWERDEHTTCLIPVTLKPNISVAPPELLEMIRCGCATDTPCSTALCGCFTAHLSCTMFYGCHGEAHCRNDHTRWVDDCDNVVQGDLFEDWVESIMAACISVSKWDVL